MKNNEQIYNYGGQVNISKDNSTLNANMTVNSESFSQVADQFFSMLSQEKDILEEDKQEITDLLNQVKLESQQGQPKKTFVKLAIQKLEKLSPLFIAGSGIGQMVSALTDSLNRWA
ncbi:hypothetical protein [Shimazuella kribbensis]|uniref:hypothetical protein n=1 Tax=Shimazuella kribbensis TaxID=139808 RepID=UPI00041755FB|nr:hypothetical protein [Shimazuella kribbensis]